MQPRLKTLEAQAYAAGRAFGYDEADFEPRVTHAHRTSRLAAVALAAGGSFLALIHFLGLTGAFTGRGAA